MKKKKKKTKQNKTKKKNRKMKLSSIRVKELFESTQQFVTKK